MTMTSSRDGAAVWPCWTLLLLLLVTVDSGQASAQLSCSAGWALHGDSCYKLHTTLLSWQGALEVCRTDGAYLARVDDIYTNDMLAMMASDASLSSFWIGLNRLDVQQSNATFSQWSDGSPSSVFQAFWDQRQPDLGAGDCAFVTSSQGHFRWAMSTCEWKRGFVCQLSACPSDSFQCSSGQCVKSSRTCDGVQDCPDGSDEMDCNALCKERVTGSGGTILSANFPNNYPASSDCQWSIEGPLGSNIFLEVNSLNTEEGKDEVVVMGGGRTPATSYTLLRMSGTTAPSGVIRSYNNFMVVRFYSDNGGEAAGFNLTWTAVHYSAIPEEGQRVLVSDTPTTLTPPSFPSPYLTNQEVVWVLYSDLPRTIITLKRESMDLAPGDYIYVRDGSDASSALLAQYSGTSGPLYVISSGPALYVLMKTTRNTALTNTGFSFSYVSGCTLSLTDNTGEIFSPGYGVGEYANYVTCTYVIQPNSGLRTTLRFDPHYDIDYDNDKLQVFIGTDSSGTAAHDELSGGYTGSLPPAPVTAPQGELFVQFSTNAIKSRAGWKAVYSNSCPVPGFSQKTICIPTCLRYDYGDTFNVTCPQGYVFDSLEFYRDAGNGSVESMDMIHMECLLGGVWNVRRYPQCVPRYCGQAPQIANGYVRSATGAVFGSTAEYACAEGFSTGDNTTITCQHDGTWQTPPVCSGAACPALSTAVSGGLGKLAEGDGVTAGSIYSFSCDSGYVLDGSPILHCNTTGQWSHPVPICQKVQCLVPSIANGRVLSGQTFVAFGVALSVQCDTPAFSLQGNATIVCQDDHTFTTLPQCQDVNECANNPCTANAGCVNTVGSFECDCLSGFTKNGSLCTNIDECAENNGGCSDICEDSQGSYGCLCPEGFSLFTQNDTQGFSVPQQETGARYGESFHLQHTCVPVQCPTPSQSAARYPLEARPRYNYQDSVTFRCKHGYLLQGQATLTCLANGTWSADLPTCEVATCPPDDIPGDLLTPPLLVVPSRTVNYGDTVFINCVVPGRSPFTKQRTCLYHPGLQEYRLQGDSYECGEVNCETPQLPPGALAIPYPANTTFGNSFPFTCDFNYDLVGSNSLGSNIITCSPDSTWTFFNISCIKRQCPYPKIPAGGNVTFEGNGFDYYDNASISCVRDGFEPKLDFLRCGVSEDGRSLSWGIHEDNECVDVKPPTFVDCPASPFTVVAYNSPGFPVPTAEDNSGSVQSLTVFPPYFHPSLPLVDDVIVNYTAVDHAGLTAECIVSIVVTETTPPALECPDATVLVISSADTNATVFDPSTANVTYNANQAVLTFSPAAPLSFTYGDVGTNVVVNVTAADQAGNSAVCQYQVVVTAAPCEPDAVNSSNTQRQCVSTNDGGYSCTFTCDQGFRFYDQYSQEAFVTSCSPGQGWTPSYVPSCVESVSVLFNMAVELQYEASPEESLSELCQELYTNSLLLLLQNADVTLKQVCSVQTDLTSVRYNNNSLQADYDNATLQYKQSFTIFMESSSGVELSYQQCYDNLRTQLTAMATALSSMAPDAGKLGTWKTLSPVGCPSVSVNGSQPAASVVRSCHSDYLRRDVNGDVVCLPCPPGTQKSASGTCDLCAVGQYWVRDAAPKYGLCVDCARGQATAGQGSIGAQACLELCEGNLVSVTGTPPCRECVGNAFALNATYCQQCPSDTRALRKENPLFSNCNAKQCSYSPRYNQQMQGAAIQVQTLTVGQCQDLCDRWENLPGTSSQCVGFNYEKILGMCFLLDGATGLASNNKYDFYQRTCSQRDQTECFCAPACQDGFYSSTGYQPDCLPCPIGFIGTGAAATTCQECPAGQTTLAQASSICVTDGEAALCQNNPCQNNGNCSVLQHDVVCTCQPGYTGRFCERVVDFCASSPCYNGGICNYTALGFSCICLSGFRGARCEENIDDCRVDSCGKRGTCVDGVNTFTCDCVDNYSGPRCDVQVQNGCDLFPCSNTSVCVPISDYHRHCDCDPGYTGPTCDVNINECESEPCMNGGVCVDEVNSFSCQCLSNFTGSTCDTPALLCSSTTCGVADDCLDDPITGLPLCICSKGYTQGELCQYSYRLYRDVDAGSVLLDTVQNVADNAGCRQLCDARGQDCQAFVFELLNRMCRMYSSVSATVAVNLPDIASLSLKSCSHPRDDYFYTEWFNSFLASLTGTDRELYSIIQQEGMRVCQDTDPVGVECRQVQSQGPVPNHVTCDLTGLTCSNANGTTCPDMEIRFRCARSRVMQGVTCRLRDVCSQGNACTNNSLCVNDPSDHKGYRCACSLGYTGDLCQLTTDECSPLPCLNNGTCIDGNRDFSCDCPPGFEGKRCERNPNDCAGNQCDVRGTARCEDGLDDYTCVCKSGYTGGNCSVNIDDCESSPCYHGGQCRDGVGSYTCDCPDGWTGPRCDSIVDKCQIATCFFQANCTTLFDDYLCRCTPGTFGQQCQNKPSVSQCSFNNPCVLTSDCALNGDQAVCNCQDGRTGDGCELFEDDSCDTRQCVNGGVCQATGAGPVCVCPDGYSGSGCEVNEDDCGPASCSSLAQCIDGVNQHFCRCPVGKALPDCVSDINEDYDMCFAPSLKTAGAALPYPLPVASLSGLTLLVWVRYEQQGGSGTFLTIYTESSTNGQTHRTQVLRLDQAGMQVNLFGNRTLTHRLFPINDGLWHLLVLFWNSASGDLDLTVDYLRQERVQNYGQGQTISGNLKIVLGGEEDDDTDSPQSSFQGCLSGLDVLSRGLDFASDLPALQQNPTSYQGDLQRWTDLVDYGNVWVARPSQARLVNCLNNPSEPLCVHQGRDNTAPVVTTCPDDVIEDTIYSETYASWQEPTFSGDGVTVSASHQSGSLFPRGFTSVVYVAENQQGNTAVCSFNVYVGEATCPARESPRGGGQQSCELNVEGFDACSVTCPAPNSTLVTDVPEHYSCGPGGQWATLQDYQGIYPTCGRIVGPARADVRLSLRYAINTGQCATITQGLTTRTREELTSLLTSWGGQLCAADDCSDVTPDVDCITLSDTSVVINLSNVSADLSSNRGEVLTVENLILTSVLDNGVFRFDTIIPGAQLDDQRFQVSVSLRCDQGQVLRDNLCVECGPGTSYNTSTGQCDNCPAGHYTADYAALSCTACSGGTTTKSVGSVSPADCKEICPAGQFYNGSSCSLCPMSFYQNETGQFECKPCPRGYLTLTEGTINSSSCAEGCESGYELLENGTCVACSEGTYRLYGSDQTCQPCPPAYTTPLPASTSADNCTVLKCPAGSKANASETGCDLCPVGQFQPGVNQLTCDPCPVNFTTAQQGSKLSTDCQRYCPSGYEVDGADCRACPVAFYKDNSQNPLSSCMACPAGYLTASDTAISKADCSIRNCTAGFYIQTDLAGVETCALCPVDTFNPLLYQRTCQNCSQGTGTRQPGADRETFCEAVCESGEQLDNGTCVACERGWYKNNTEDRFGLCSPCPADSITPSDGATSLDDCKVRNCSAGTYLEQANNTCVECPLNTYQPDRWMTSCLPCPTERVTQNTGSTSQSQCLLSCDRGREDVNGTCQECAVGFFKNETRASLCSACPQGLRTNVTGSTSEAACTIAACEAGTYLNGTANVCQACPYGQYQPGVWKDSCQDCPQGSTTFTQGATSQAQCLKDCPAGTALDQDTDTCDPCDRGLYRDKSSPTQTSCVLCDGAVITPGTGSISSGNCSVANCTAPGFYLDTGSNSCEQCPEGSYNSLWWAEQCTSCAPGFTTKTSGMADNSSCYRDCPSGQQVDEVTNVCAACVQGTYRDRSQTWTCQPCPPYLTTPSTGSSSLANCSIPTCGPGYYYVAQPSSCVACALGTFQSQGGMTSCDLCPNHKTTLTTARVSADDCVSLCRTSMNTCSSNAACSVDNGGNIQCSCNANYQGDGTACTHVCDLTDAYCLNGASCYKDRAQACVCGEYYSGPRCQSRADPSASASDTEIIVGTVIGVVTLLLILLLILIAIILRRRRMRPTDKDSLSTSGTHSKAPSAIIPRANLQNYQRSLNGGDPAYYNAGEANRDLPYLPYDNVTFRYSGGST